MKRRSFVPVWLLCLVWGAALPGCGLIDERMDNCPEESTLTLTLDLVNNKAAEMDNKLGSEHDRPLRAALEDYLTDVFVDKVHDVDLSFFDQRRRHERTFHETLVMDAAQKVISLRLSASDYLVVGAANLSGVPMVSLKNVEEEEGIALVQNLTRHVDSHPAGLFTARKRMRVADDEDQRLEIDFHMINSAAALVLNCDSCTVRSIKAEYDGLGNAFRIADSAFAFTNYSLIRADEIDVEPYIQRDADISNETDWFYDPYWELWTTTPRMLCGVGFPSPSVASSVAGTAIRIWGINLYVTLDDGTVTLSELSIGAPLPPGSLMIIKGWIKADGSFSPVPPVSPHYVGPGGPIFPDPPVDSTVVTGVSVKLNWRDGGEYGPVIG